MTLSIDIQEQSNGHVNTQIRTSGPATHRELAQVLGVTEVLRQYFMDCGDEIRGAIVVTDAKGG